MWGMPKPPPQATWKKVEDDFVLGACTYRLFGFMSRGADGIWTAFDDDSEPLGSFVDQRDGMAVLWTHHEPEHLATCAAVGAPNWRAPHLRKRPSETLPTNAPLES